MAPAKFLNRVKFMSYINLKFREEVIYIMHAIYHELARPWFLYPCIQTT